MQTRTFVDRGGTFTDVVVVHEGSTDIYKVPSDRAVVGELARGELTFGTTVATNALLQRSTVPVLLVVNEGMEDLARIRDMRRPALFDPDALWPAPLATRVMGVAGRVSAQGEEVEPLVLPEAWPLDGIEAVAVVLMHSPRHPEHERQIAASIERAARERGQKLLVVLGHEVCPTVGYLARIETALVEAGATPLLQRALVADRIGPSARAMRSDGSTTRADQLGAADAVLSGPASGVLAVYAVAVAAGVRSAIGLDMGGTSTDVCMVDTEAPLPMRQGDLEVAGVWLRRPMLDVETIAAGGGSILWSDGTQLRVGPASAGASPGPQCYGRGGPPTLTDAALALDLCDAGAFHPPLDRAKIALPGPAEAFLDLARHQMADAIQRLAARRGLDPREHALVSFGGAAGQHAAGVAELLSIDLVLVHPASSVLCAWGQQMARPEAHAVRALWLPFPDGYEAMQEVLAELSSTLPPGTLPPGGERRATADLRHVGTDTAIEIELDSAPRMVLAFLEAHRRTYGFDRSLPIELVDLHVRSVDPRPSPPPALAADWTISASGSLLSSPVEGPLRLDTATTSVVLPRGWRAVLQGGLLRLERVQRRPIALPEERTPHAVALWASRLVRVASLAGAVLERTARSVNIRERLDFSCAIFDSHGQLVANAPHVPVHLGSMGETVRDLLAHTEDNALTEGQHWLTNDPAAGGSHLPDLTVMTPVRWDGVRMFVACRAHHVDVGGLTPGSMPPRSTSLLDEGFVVRRLPLLEAGRLRSDLDAHLRGCRQLEVVRADLEAQIAANVTAARELAALGPGPLVARWAEHLLEVADASMDKVREALPDSSPVVRDLIDGVPLSLRLYRGTGALVVDLQGTGGPHAGNLNAPLSVVRAAVLYALAVLAGNTLLLNEGAMRRVRLRVPLPCIAQPPVGAAVAGGNVETSQRVADLVLRAAGFGASSGGSMSNLTLGGTGWSLYETVGCGQGGSPRSAGPSGRQVHMTNTRATDPEILETRLPLRLRRFALREGSGGAGLHRGGDGLLREIEVLVPARAALLATRRERGAPGEEGGAPGAPGQDEVWREGAWHPWDGDALELQPHDRVRVGTPGGGGWSASLPALVYTPPVLEDP